MGIHYGTVDSSQRQSHETSSKFNVKLPNPIHRALTVKLQSASIVNEFFTVREDNSNLYLAVYPMTGGVIDDDGDGLVDFSLLEISFEPGVYTVPELVDEFNRKISSVSNADRLDVDISMTLLDTQKVSLKCSSIPSKERLVALGGNLTDGGHETRILYQLGFSRNQVTKEAEIPFL